MTRNKLTFQRKRLIVQGRRPARQGVINVRHSVLVAACGAMLLAGCDAPPSSSPATAETSNAREDLEAATAAFHEALRTNDAGTFLSFAAEDVVMMPPGEAPVRGKAALQTWYEGFLTQYQTTSLSLGDQEVFLGDGWAVELGTYEWGLAAAAGGGPVVDRGNYMQVWKLQPDGQWRFAREVYNSSVPVAAPAT